MKCKNVLIGLAHVSSTIGNEIVLDGAKGGYVNILCYASDEADFISNVNDLLISMGLKLLEIEDIELVSERMNKYDIEECLLNLLPQINEESKIKLGIFHTYD